jgi:thiosulfate reductase cytochrome b subunit
MTKRFLLTGLILTIAAFLGLRSALAKPEPAPVLSGQTTPFHPTFALLDQSGENVLTSGSPVSTMQTCGQCHDTEFIQSHAFHSDLGLSDYQENGDYNSSPGTFGKWNPLTYRFLSQQGDERLDLGTPEWLMLYGDRIVGGGPATTSRDGKPLESAARRPDNPEAAFLSEDGSIELWHWDAGTMEMNCFLCHLENPNLPTRREYISVGGFDYASMATLDGTGIVTRNSQDGGLDWNTGSFDENGELKPGFVKIQDPTNSNCAACHGEIHTVSDVPLTISAYDLSNPQTATTGQVISAQKISGSGLNLSGKKDLTRSWDIHAERQLQCTDCHYALNNPAHAGETRKTQPDHLLYDPRVLDISEYLQRPDHNFARGQSAQYNVAPELKGTMRRCESCHDATQGHADWLPYVDQHMTAVACETCHIPQMYAPAIQSYDWTVLTLDKQPVKTYRGVEGDPAAVTSLVTGYKPVLLNRTNIDGQKLLAPYNLITSYYWVYDDASGNKRPVRLLDLETVYFENGAYAADIVPAFDANRDGSLSSDELVINSSEKEEAVRAKLASLGLGDPRIEGLTQPYSINHNVTRGENSVNECKACHNDDSRISQPIKLADYSPNNVLPLFDTSNNVNASGEITRTEDGAVYYNPVPANDRMYVFGSSRVNWIDWLGALMFAGTLLGVTGHGTLRILSSRKQANGPKRTERIFMYQAYERFWHWLQTVAIIILLFTGLIIHRPDIFGAFSFDSMVIIHNVIAAILAVNAILALFYHLSTETIRRYIPHPHGFFDDTFKQLVYYTRGIFDGGRHPFEKTPGKRLNPLQQATYFMILHVLLPLQGLTGILMWGVQKWPSAAYLFGGLPFLAPFHSLVAWTFASFIVAHVYLTTTGATPLEAMRGMVTGYEEVEVHEHEEEVKEEGETI